MITFVRTFAIAPGRLSEAVAFAHQGKKLIKEKIGVDVGLSMPIGGNPHRIAFVSAYPGLAEFETAMKKLMADADYLKFVASGAPNVIAGSLHDELWQTL